MDLRARLLIAAKQRGYVAHWNQLDITDEEHPRPTVPVGDLQKLE